MVWSACIYFSSKLEQLGCLRSEDTPRRPMITHTTDSYRIPSQSYTQLHTKEFAKTSNFGILHKTLRETHLLKSLDKMCKYEMDPASIVEGTVWTWCHPQTDRKDETIITPFQLRWSWGMMRWPLFHPHNGYSWVSKWVSEWLSLTAFLGQQTSGSM